MSIAKIVGYNCAYFRQKVLFLQLLVTDNHNFGIQHQKGPPPKVYNKCLRFKICYLTRDINILQYLKKSILATFKRRHIFLESEIMCQQDKLIRKILLNMCILPLFYVYDFFNYIRCAFWQEKNVCLH